MAAESQIGVLDSRVSLVKQHVTEEPVPEFSTEVRAPTVETHPDTGHVEKVTLDEHVSHLGPLAVQIPPEADGTRNSTLGVLAEPTVEDVFAGRHSEASSVNGVPRVGGGVNEDGSHVAPAEDTAPASTEPAATL